MDWGSDRTVWRGGGYAALGILVLIVGVPLAVLLLQGARTDAFPPTAYLFRLITFTVEQALLSTALSLLGAVPVALAMARRPQFFGRRIVVALMLLPLGLPVLPAVFGLLEIWGRAGYANDLLAWFGLSRISIYGLSGILLAHVFFNLPLAARLMLSALRAVPENEWRLAATLGLPRLSIFRFIEWPALLRVVPGIAGLILMLCVTSFTIVLTLGGGPRSSTLEIAIYQALKFEFDPPRALVLVLIQLVLTGLIYWLISRLPQPEGDSRAQSGRSFRPDAMPIAARLGDGAIILLFLLFTGLPLLALVAGGMAANLVSLAAEPIFHKALITSLLIASFAGLLSAVLAFVLTRAMVASGSQPSLLTRAVALPQFLLLLPPLALGSGWFILLLGLGFSDVGAPVIVVLINLCMGLPFALRVLRPAMSDHYLRTGRLATSLNLRGFARLRMIDLPVLGKPLLTAFSFAAALSMGDLGAIALFSTNDFITLPALLYARLGSYRSMDAAGLSLILAIICLVLMIPAIRNERFNGVDVR